jgi:hypothetical protein
MPLITPGPTISGGLKQVPASSQKSLPFGSGRVNNEVSVPALVILTAGT